MPTARSSRHRDPFDVSHLVSEGAERQVLAGLLDIIDRDMPAATEVASGLSVEMFNGDGTGDVFNAIRDVLASVAEATVADVLTALRGAGNGHGTPAYTLLVDLAADRLGTGPQAARLAREAAIEVRELYERRQVIEAAALVVQSGGKPDDIGTLVRHLERVRAASDAAAGNRPLTLIDCIDQWAKHERTPTIPTGMHWFDGPTEGGLPIGGIVAIVAYPGAGKTALCIQLALAALVNDSTLTCVWALGELAPHAMGRRMTCVAAAVLPNCEPVTTSDAGRRSKAARAAGVALCHAIGERLAVVSPPLTVAAIDARVASTGARLVVIDYLQLIRSTDKAADRVQELDTIIGQIRDMAIKRDCAVVIVSSMARATSTTSRAGQLARGSAEVDYAVELLYAGEVEEHDGKPDIGPDGTVGVAWRCKKARNLEPRDLLLRFDGATQTYDAAEVVYTSPANGHADFAGFAARGDL
jgi:replicative DNA helicase